VQCNQNPCKKLRKGKKKHDHEETKIQRKENGKEEEILKLTARLNVAFLSQSRFL
jgi:hypothetical protein